MNDKKKNKTTTRFNISLTKEDMENYEELKKELAPNTKSGMFRFLMKYAINNLDLVKKVHLPDSQSNQILDEQISKLKQVLIEENKVKEREKKEQIEMKEDIKGLKTNIEKIMIIMQENYPEAVKKANNQTNGLGGKLI